MKLLCLLGCLLLLAFQTDSFKAQQRNYPRVREAYTTSEATCKQQVLAAGLSWPLTSLYMRVFKEEKQLELWGKSAGRGTYKKINTYAICAASGDPGPKRKEGDNQVPEGFYLVDRFNPNSSFYLSLGLNYPNASDRILSDKTSPGGNIFIHGSCVSIGCMAMQDEKIKELYVMAVEARNAGSSIPVHIFPSRFSTEVYSALQKRFPEHVPFWKSLEPAYTHFEKQKTLPIMKANSKGQYYQVL
ncbi:MAG: L,D-transpeptidase family protein [Cytophagaceae bacterium]|jgi:murein L,D-transpeptidase YafK|nr:L,D-transpeptidase family protein [Cytophagaceae bacterium]